MVSGRNGSLLFLFLLILIPLGAGDRSILLNGTNIYLATGDNYGLYQGYVLNLKSASVDGSAWLELTDNDRIVKSEIVQNPGEFVYNRNNNTIISVKVGKVYSGSTEQNLLSLYIYQFTDPEKPLPSRTVVPENNETPDNARIHPKITTPGEPLIWTLGIILVLVLFYIAHRLW